MNKYFNKLYSFILSLPILLPLADEFAVYAADSNSTEPDSIPKAVIVLIMIALFIISSLVAAFITYRMRKSNSSSPTEEINAEQNNQSGSASSVQES